MVTREGGESIFISPTQYTAMEIPLDVPTHAGKAELGKIDAGHKQPHTAYVPFRSAEMIRIEIFASMRTTTTTSMTRSWFNPHSDDRLPSINCDAMTPKETALLVAAR